MELRNAQVNATRLARIQVWYVSEISEDGHFCVMLRQRSGKDGDAQGGFGVPLAGCVASGEHYEQALPRLLAEQLEQERAEECVLFFDLPMASSEGNCRVYLLLGMRTCTPYLRHATSDQFEWIDAERLLSSLQAGDARYGVDAGVLQQIIGQYTGVRDYTVHITDPWSAPGAGSYAGSDEWTYDATYTYFGTLKDAMEQGREYVSNFRDDVNPNLASVVYWLT